MLLPILHGAFLGRFLSGGILALTSLDKMEYAIDAAMDAQQEAKTEGCVDVDMEVKRTATALVGSRRRLRTLDVRTRRCSSKVATDPQT